MDRLHRPPYAYLSHPIHGIGDDTVNGEEGGVGEPDGVGLLADALAECGVYACRPLLHNPWNPKCVVPEWLPQVSTHLALESLLRTLAQQFDRSPGRWMPQLPEMRDLRPACVDLHQRSGIGAAEVVNLDLGFLAGSSIVFSFLEPLSVGTAQEQMYAGFLRKPVIGVVYGNPQEPNVAPKLSKWAIEHCRHIFTVATLLRGDNLRSLLKAYAVI